MILSSDKCSERNLSSFFDIKKPRKIEYLQSGEPFSSDPYFSTDFLPIAIKIVLVEFLPDRYVVKSVLKYGSEEKGSWLYRCSPLLGFIMSKKQERLRSELLSEDKITNLLVFLT